MSPCRSTSSPTATTLRLLIRAPLAAMRDLTFPLRGPGTSTFARLERQPRDAASIWIADYIRIYEDARELPEETIVATRISLPSDRSFVTYDSALAGVHVARRSRRHRRDVGPAQARRRARGPDHERERALFDRPHARAPGRHDHQRAALRDAVRHRARVPVRAATRDSSGSIRAGTRPRATFVALGFEHILDGFDHLLFVLCLVVPIRRVRPLVAVITSFTAGAFDHADRVGAGAGARTRSGSRR